MPWKAGPWAPTAPFCFSSAWEWRRYRDMLALAQVCLPTADLITVMSDYNVHWQPDRVKIPAVKNLENT